jgi:hypothetical protein
MSATVSSVSSVEQDDSVVLQQRGQPQCFSSMKNIGGLEEQEDDDCIVDGAVDKQDQKSLPPSNHHNRQQHQQHPGRGMTKYRSVLGASSRRGIFGMLLRIEDNEDGFLSDDGSVGHLDGFEDPSGMFDGGGGEDTTNAGSVVRSLDGRRIYMLEAKKTWNSQYSQFSQSTFEESIQLAMSQAPDETTEDDDQSLDPSMVSSLKSEPPNNDKFHSSFQSCDQSLASSAISSKIVDTPAAKFHSPFASSTAASAEICRQVSFGDVTINEHLVVVGDNPGGCGGTPVTLGWESLQQHKISLDRYETARDGHRRPFARLRMAKDHREKVLREIGFSRSERMAGLKAAYGNIAVKLTTW